MLNAVSALSGITCKLLAVLLILLVSLLYVLRCSLLACHHHHHPFRCRFLSLTCYGSMQNIMLFNYNSDSSAPSAYTGFLPQRNPGTGQLLPFYVDHFKLKHNEFWWGNEDRDESFVKLCDELRCLLELSDSKTFLTKEGRRGIMNQMAEYGRRHLGKLTSSEVWRLLNAVKRYFWIVKLAEERYQAKIFLSVQSKEHLNERLSVDEINTLSENLYSIERQICRFCDFMLPDHSEDWVGLSEKYGCDSIRLFYRLSYNYEGILSQIEPPFEFQIADYLKLKMKLANEIGIWRVGSFEDLYYKLVREGKIRSYCARISDEDEEVGDSGEFVDPVETFSTFSFEDKGIVEVVC